MENGKDTTYSANYNEQLEKCKRESLIEKARQVFLGENFGSIK